jgi:UDP-N-acetylmuramate dehydrogenase
MLKVSNNPDLSQRTTLRLGGTAIAEVEVRSPADLETLPQTVKALGGAVRVLGKGSNILARDGRLPIVLIRPAFFESPEIIGQHPAHALVSVGSGARLPRLLGRLASWGFSGLEKLAGIPGTVGGAIAMNAGAFGADFCSCLASVRIFTPLKGLVDVPAEDIRYGYRKFAVPGLTDKAGWFLITGCTLRLNRADKNACMNALREIYQQKKAVQPIFAHSAGCVFKNPSGYASAGKLLDMADMRGASLGGLSFSAMHANFMVNDKKAKGTASQALFLMEMGVRAVQARFGIGLLPEITIW